MANVIIPVEHQSAPKSIIPSASQVEEVREYQRSKPKSGPTSWEKYDNEMDLPDDNPIVEAQVRELERRDRARSSNAMVEELLRQHELSEMQASCQRWEGEERWQGRENEEMRLVRIYHPYTFLKKLRRAGVDARPEESPSARIWLNSWTRVGRIGVNAWVYRGGRMVPETITTLQYPYAPEYSIMRFDDHNVPTNERYRGWRTTLLTLICADVITEPEAEKAFGPALGPAGEFYRQQLFLHRRIALGLDKY